MTDINSVVGNSTANLTATQAPLTSGSKPSDDLANQDTFLKLLVAQLQYQDPSNPVDSSQFMAQTAQFSMVQKLDALATSTTEMLNESRIQAGSSMLGRQVTYTGSDGQPVTGVVASMRIDPANGPVLQVGGKDVAMSAVTNVSNPAAPATATSTGA